MLCSNYHLTLCVFIVIHMFILKLKSETQDTLTPETEYLPISVSL